MRDMKPAMEAFKALSSGVSKIIALMEAAANATACISSWRPLTPPEGNLHPPLGRPPEVYQRFEEEYLITRGPEGIYTRLAERPGLGWDVEVT
jgi:hypothetical protein